MEQTSYWTPDEESILRTNWGTITSKQIYEKGLLPGRTLKAIRHHASFMGLKSGIRAQIHTIDRAFWSVPNHINAYWAGEIASDGCILKRSDRNETYVLQLAVSVHDIKHLELFKQATGYTGPIRTYESTCSISTSDVDKLHMLAYVRLCQMRYCVDDLRDLWGIVPHKTYRVAPPAVLSDNVLKLCYICGYLDGDGSLTIDSDRGIPFILVSSCSQRIMEWFKVVMDDLFRVSLRKFQGTNVTRPSLNSNCWRFALSGYRAAKVIDIMSRLPVPKMDRKWRNPEMLDLIELYRQRYPVEWSIRLPIEDEIDAYLATLKPAVAA